MELLVREGREMVVVGTKNYGTLDQCLKGCSDEIFSLEDDNSTNIAAGLQDEEIERNYVVVLPIRNKSKVQWLYYWQRRE